MPYFVQGLTMGLAYVAPIGVQNLFVIHSALAHPRRRTPSRSGDRHFSMMTLALACFWVGVVMETFPVVRMAVLLAGSLVVLAIGVGLLRTKEAGAEGRPLPATGSKTVSTAFVVTWCNPQALIDGTMMLGAFRATLPTAQASSFISGVALASCLWFLGVTLVVSLLSRHFTPGVMVWINRVCGVVILCYGGSLLWSFLTMLG